jgi:Ca-activated chloride channel family protein
VIEQFQLLRPLWLLAIIPALLVTLLLWSARSSGANWRRAIAPELLEHLLDEQHERRVRWPWWLVFAGWLLGCVALAGPTWEKLPQPVLQNRDAVVVVLDLSLSMIAADVQPSRLQRARFKILDLLHQRRDGLTGLVAYSGDAHIVTPLTDDTDTIANLVPALAPDMMPVYGSDVVGGVTQALQLLQSSGVARGRVLLITDDIAETDIGALTSVMGKTRHTLAILGIGTAQGAPIPVNGGFLKEPDGSIALPQLHRERLQKLAAQSGGIYRDLSADDSDLHSLLPDSAPQDSELRTTERQFDQWRERGPWLVLLIIPFAALAFRRGWLLMLLVTLMIATPDAKAADPASVAPQEATSKTHQETTQEKTQTDALLRRGSQLWRNLWSTSDQQASKRLEQGDARGAAKQFSDPAWRASAQYRAGDYEQSAKNFETLLGPDGKPTADADYNRGNALARAGQLQQALAAYHSALQKNPALDDAKANQKLVEDLLKQQQKTEPDTKPGENKDQQSQQQDQQSQQSSSANNQQQRSGDQQSQQDSQQQAARNADKQEQKNQAGQPQAGDPSQNSSQQNPSQSAMNKDQQQAADAEKKKSEQSALQSKPEQDAKDNTQQNGQQSVDTKALTPEQQRQQQVMEQWLRQIPDDPSGLLRRKFDYEHRERSRPAENPGDRSRY